MPAKGMHGKDYFGPPYQLAGSPQCRALLCQCYALLRELIAIVDDYDTLEYALLLRIRPEHHLEPSLYWRAPTIHPQLASPLPALHST